MHRWSSLAIVAGLFLALKAQALTPQQILEKSDENVTKVQDQQYDASMAVFENGKLLKTVTMTIALKGLYKKLIRFTGPSDVKGMSILTLEDGIMYVYLPTYKKIRRVASHVKEQGFMGSDFEYDDMAQSALSSFYNAYLIDENKDEWNLKLTPKPGSNASRSRLDVTVRKEGFITNKVTVYTETGAKYKTQIRSNYQNFSGLFLPQRIEIISHISNHKSVLDFTNVRSNKGLSDDMFTKRVLMREE